MKKPFKPTLAKLIQAEAKQCVKCGLCLPHCPTYIKTQHEGESPRGRIALMTGITQGLTITTRVKQHLDQCLTCRACEKVCPAHVPYGQLIDHAREWLEHQGHSTLPQLIDIIITKPVLLKWLFTLLRFYQRLGIQPLLTRTPLLRRSKLNHWNTALPILYPVPKWQSFYPAQGKERGKVALFLGCLHPYLDAKTISDSIKVLTACGYSIFIPANQACCGALHLHAGKTQQAHAFIQQNYQTFACLKGCIAIISLASGCGITLHEQSLPFPTTDINQFLLDILVSDALKPLPMRIILHTPCTQEFGLRQGDIPYHLLKQIPQLSITTLPKQCCGAAGINMLTQPEMANSLLNDIVNLVKFETADVLVTANLGCMLHIMRGFKQHSIAIPSLHPINLIAKALSLA